MTSSADEGHESLPWPAHLLDVAEVRAWLTAALPNHPRVVGPVAVHWVKVWGVTARFTVESAQETLDEVVFKSSCLSLFDAAPRIAAMLFRQCPENVPEPLAWTEHRGQVWTAFRPFSGEPIASISDAGTLPQMARTFAGIQVAVTRLPTSVTADLPAVTVDQLPALFAAVLDEIATRNLSYWQTHRDRLAADLHIAPTLLDPGVLLRLARFERQVATWAAELEAGGWPMTIDHVDLHGNNAVCQADGRILIYDWEEATLGCPFFSLDRLLEDARHADGRGAPGALGPMERAVQHAYLDALPWQRLPDRRRALDVALRLAPIKAAYEGKIFAEALGWEDGCPWVTALAVARALERWQRHD